MLLLYYLIFTFSLLGVVMEDKDKLKWIYSSKDNLELSAHYDQWAKSYDTDLIQDYGWKAPQVATDFVKKYVPKDSKILDVGAGTGLVGQCLHQEGYRDLVGIDLSEMMLEEARNKKVYRELYKMVLGETLFFSDGIFDAAICVGIFTFGHAPASSLDELVRITKPKGHIIFLQRSDANVALGFKEKQVVLETAGRWNLVEARDSLMAYSKKESDLPHQVWVYQVT